MKVVEHFSLFVGILLCATICTGDLGEGRSLGLLKPYGGGGQTYHYERYGGNGGGFFGKYPGYGYESFTSIGGGGYGKPFHGHGFGNGYGHGFGHGYGSGFGHGFYPGYGYPYYPYPSIGPGFGYGFGPGFG